MTIEERIDQLERTNRTWRRIAGLLAVLMVAAVGIGAVQSDAEELVLRKLVIQDEQGRHRIVMTSKEGKASIRNYDADAVMRIGITTTPDGSASIEHHDAKGKKRVATGSLANEQAFIQHLDTGGKIRIVGGTTPEGKAAVQYHDLNERKRIFTGTLSDGSAITAWWKIDADGNATMAKSLP